MARPHRNTVDYFPFYCAEGKKMYYLEEKYGNDGFAVFLKILRELAKSEHHYLDLSKKTTLMFLSAKCKVSVETLQVIINDLVDLEKFDSILWNENKIIWCQDFIDSIQDAYNKRINNCITYDGLLSLLVGLGVRKPTKSDSEGDIKPQSILEYSKEDKSIYKQFSHLKISIEKNNKLINLGYKQDEIDSVYESIENYKKNTQYKSLYLTSKKWLKKEYGDRKIRPLQTKPLPKWECKFNAAPTKIYECDTEEEARELYFNFGGAYPQQVRQIK